MKTLILFAGLFISTLSFAQSGPAQWRAFHAGKGEILLEIVQTRYVWADRVFIYKTDAQEIVAEHIEFSSDPYGRYVVTQRRVFATEVEFQQKLLSLIEMGTIRGGVEPRSGDAYKAFPNLSCMAGDCESNEQTATLILGILFLPATLAVDVIHTALIPVRMLIPSRSANQRVGKLYKKIKRSLEKNRNRLNVGDTQFESMKQLFGNEETL